MNYCASGNHIVMEEHGSYLGENFRLSSYA